MEDKELERKRLIIAYQRLEKRFVCHEDYWEKEKLITKDKDKKTPIDYRTLQKMSYEEIEKIYNKMEKKMGYFLELCQIYGVKEKEIINSIKV